MRSLFRASTISAFIIAGCLLGQMSLSGQVQKRARGKRLASINGIAITEAQVRKESADELESLELKKLKEKASFAQDEQEILEKALERLVEEKLLEAEAAKQGISQEELIAREIDGKAPETTSGEIRKLLRTEQTTHQNDKGRSASRDREISPQAKND